MSKVSKVSAPARRELASRLLCAVHLWRKPMSRWTCSTCCWGARGQAGCWWRRPRPCSCGSSATARRCSSSTSQWHALAGLVHLVAVPIGWCGCSSELVGVKQSCACSGPAGFDWYAARRWVPAGRRERRDTRRRSLLLLLCWPSGARGLLRHNHIVCTPTLSHSHRHSPSPWPDREMHSRLSD